MTSLCLESNIFVPPVLDSGLEGENYFFKMQYVHGDNALSFLNSESINLINWFVHKLLNFIDINISKSRYIQANTTILNKINQIKDKLNKKQADHLINYVKNEVEKSEMMLPVGPCHGDLTFSNVIISRGHKDRKLNLIDFLDSFLDTPLQDIVKLRQDTSFKWTLQLYDGKINHNRINSIFKHLDKKINNFFKKYQFYTSNYKTYQIINLLRVMPYADEQKLNYLINCANFLKNIED
jgi:tRNA A-37 threonylcarbamoyl transferase component Bud32